MRIILFTILLLFCYTTLFAQDLWPQFQTAINKSDTATALSILQKWDKTGMHDVNFYVANFNYYAKKSMTEVLHMDPSQSGDKSLVVSDPKTNKPVAYINDGVSVDTHILDKGFSYIDMGISKYPDRLDLRFGEIYMLGKIPDYDKFTSKLILTIDYSNKIQSKWLWIDNKPLTDPVKFMLNAEQDYVGQLLDAQQLDKMREVAKTVLKYYPNNVENLSNLAITYMLNKDYDTALSSLLKANKIDPTDAVVIGNIAYCYKGLGNKPRAIEYYRLAEKYGDKDGKAYATQQIKELEK